MITIMPRLLTFLSTSESARRAPSDALHPDKSALGRRLGRQHAVALRGLARLLRGRPDARPPRRGSDQPPQLLRRDSAAPGGRRRLHRYRGGDASSYSKLILYRGWVAGLVLELTPTALWD